ncbi:hypothetical protein ACFL42_04185 [Candidatus Omnitrophota bacterium]
MKISKLTHGNIRPYGWIIDSRCVKDPGYDNRFGILLKERSKGWRIGYLIVREASIKRLESHPDSLETFEPVKGRAIIALAGRRTPGKPRVFLLDKPVVLKKGIWHDVAAVSRSRRCEIKIFENIEVKTEYFPLKKPVVVG